MGESADGGLRFVREFVVAMTYNWENKDDKKGWVKAAWGKIGRIKVVHLHWSSPNHFRLVLTYFIEMLVELPCLVSSPLPAHKNEGGTVLAVLALLGYLFLLAEFAKAINNHKVSRPHQVPACQHLLARVEL